MAQKDPCCIDEVATVGGEGGEGEEGSGKVVKRINDTNGAQQVVVPLTKINPSPVDWQSVCRLPSKDKTYKETIMKNISALFPEGCKGTGLSVFVGALYVHSASGHAIDSRVVYFESSDPNQPGARVARYLDAKDKVLSFGWDRINLVYYQVAAESSEYTFQIFTPAISGTYGLIVREEELIFEELEGNSFKTQFTEFHIEIGEKANYITTTIQDNKFGMYVDTSDEWKLKVTKKKHEWDKFWITRLALPTKAVVDEVVEARSDS